MTHSDEQCSLGTSSSLEREKWRLDNLDLTAGNQRNQKNQRQENLFVLNFWDF